MSKKFNNLNKLFKQLEKEITRSMNSDVAQKVKETQSEQVKEKVFDVYDPFLYKRRASGGLDDTSNMYHEVKQVGGSIELSIENKTTGLNDTNFEIAGLVEHGHQTGYGEYDYDYNRDGTAYKYLNPRKFIEGTRRELARTNLHTESLKRSLRSKGIDIK